MGFGRGGGCSFGDRGSAMSRAESITGRCDLHNVFECGTCFHAEGECQYGACHAPAVFPVPCFGPKGTVVERRPACGDHVAYGPHGVGYGFEYVEV